VGKGGLNPHGHKWRFCIRCNEWQLECGRCGKKTCEPGRKCPACKSARVMQDNADARKDN